jgi:hypothetical protein
MRPWIAVVAAYALALQVLLSGLAAGQLIAADDSTGSLFVICHSGGNTPSDDPQAPAQTPSPQWPCILCTLAKAPSAVLPASHAVVAVLATTASIVAPEDPSRIFAFDSPTGRYQRGPPIILSISG